MSEAMVQAEDLLRLDSQLCFSIYAASRAFTRAYRPFLERLHLTYPQYLVLLTLWESDGEPVSRIGRRLFLDSGTLTPLLKRMESLGYIERRRCCEDERKVEIWLTQSGKDLKRQAVAIPQELIKEANLCDADMNLTKKLVDTILHKLLEVQVPEDQEPVV